MEKFRKFRNKKTFSDKFPITDDKIKPSMEREISKKLGNLKIKINHKNIKESLVSLNLYLGTFYIKPSDANFKLLNLNLEDIYQDLVMLNKQEHNDNDWVYNNNEFQKIYVLKFDGKNAIVALTYNDSFVPFIIDTIYTSNIVFEGNMAKSARE